MSGRGGGGGWPNTNYPTACWFTKGGPSLISHWDPCDQNKVLEPSTAGFICLGSGVGVVSRGCLFWVYCVGIG